MDQPSIQLDQILQFGKHQMYVVDGELCVMVLSGDLDDDDLVRIVGTLELVSRTAGRLTILCDVHELGVITMRARHRLARLGKGAQLHRTQLFFAGADRAQRGSLAVLTAAARLRSTSDLRVSFVPDRRTGLSIAHGSMAAAN